MSLSTGLHSNMTWLTITEIFNATSNKWVLAQRLATYYDIAGSCLRPLSNTYEQLLENLTGAPLESSVKDRIWEVGLRNARWEVNEIAIAEFHEKILEKLSEQEASALLASPFGVEKLITIATHPLAKTLVSAFSVHVLSISQILTSHVINNRKEWASDVANAVIQAGIQLTEDS